MGIIQLRSIKSLRFDNTIGEVPEGFSQASFRNLGDNPATLTQNGNSWTLAKGEVFNIGNRKDEDAWMLVEVDASSTIVECVYFK